MAVQYRYDHQLQIAGIQNDSGWHRMNVLTLLQSPGNKQPSVSAYLGARYSRSADSVYDIAAEVMRKGTDAASRLESIFHGYGHKSVGDMADVFICFENVPMITAMRLFNTNLVIAGQERSTRFQNFEDPQFIDLPLDIDVSPELREEYGAIIHEWMKHYREMLPSTQDALGEFFEVDREDPKQASVLMARTFDTVRYFLPLGLQTSLGYVMSARSWSELISRLRGSNQRIDLELGEMLYELLVSNDELTSKGYVPEVDGLIRHADANKTQREMFLKAREYLSSIGLDTLGGIKMPELSRIGQYLKVGRNPDPVDSFIQHMLLLLFPLSTEHKILTANERTELGKIFFEFHNHHKLAGNIAQSGAYMIDGMADQGVLKDLNRHRSFERFVPLWDNSVDMTQELDRNPENSFFLCEYLYNTGFESLRGEFSDRMTQVYDRIQKWHTTALKELGEDLAREFTRYLLPHAHATRYRFYASLDDLQYTINLRTRNGGHIAYRKHTYDWLRDLVVLDPFWKGLEKKLPKVDAESKEQFMDRS